MGFIVRNLNLDQISFREDSIHNNITLSICEFFYSLYEGGILIGVSAVNTTRFSRQKMED
jgi:hypothetical protein